MELSSPTVSKRFHPQSIPLMSNCLNFDMNNFTDTIYDDGAVKSSLVYSVFSADISWCYNKYLNATLVPTLA